MTEIERRVPVTSLARWLLLASACALLSACKGSGSEPGASAHDGGAAAKPPAPAASAAPAVAASSSAASAPPPTLDSAAAKAPPPAVTAFGPDISKVAVEAINASHGYEFNQPQHALDGKPTTSWSAPGDSKRVWLEVGLLPETKIDGIELSGQRADKSGAVDRWTANAVMKRIRVVWDGGEGELAFSRAADKGVRKKLSIGAVTRRLRLEVLETEPGEKSKDIDIDELKIFGAAPATKPRDPKGQLGLCKAERVAVRFDGGTVFGGEWTDESDPTWAWTFFPIPVRVDDGQWHTLGVRYVENADVLEDRQKVIKSTNVGKLFRFRLSPDGFEVDNDGIKATGKCGLK